MAYRGIGAARLSLVALVLALGIAAGCSKSENTGGSGPAIDPMTQGGGASPQDVLAKLPGGDEFAAGKKVYADNKCANCHKLGDTGGGMPPGTPPPPGGAGAPPPPAPGGKGPDLTKVGGKADRTKQWIADHIRDAKKHKPGSKMPEYGPDKISDADLDKLAEYLASRK